MDSNYTTLVKLGEYAEIVDFQGDIWLIETNPGPLDNDGWPIFEVCLSDHAIEIVSVLANWKMEKHSQNRMQFTITDRIRQIQYTMQMERQYSD